MSEDVLFRYSFPADLWLAYGSDPNQFIDLRLLHPTVMLTASPI